MQFGADVSGERKNVSLSDVLHVPDLRTNLVSVGKITDRGYEVYLKKDQSIGAEFEW